MRLTIFAATGGAGRHLLDQAVAAGHDVTAAVPDASKLPPGPRAVTADLAAPDPVRLECAVDGADAVLSALGPRSASGAGIVSRGTRAEAEMEDVLRASGLAWTVVRPPRLHDRPPNGGYRTAYGQNVRRGYSASRADVADLMLRVLAEPAAIGQAVGIARQPRKGKDQ